MVLLLLVSVFLQIGPFLACKLITTLTGKKEVKAMLHCSGLTHSRGQAGTGIGPTCHTSFSLRIVLVEPASDITEHALKPQEIERQTE